MGLVFDIQRCSLHDGPGIRTTVFLMGCNLRCAWCHNPESFRLSPTLRFKAARCVGCGACVAACPLGAQRAVPDGSPPDALTKVDRARCVGCGACVATCSRGALSLSGRELSAGEVLTEVQKDRRYYGDDGGVTFSGGEPSVQFPFLLELAEACAAAGIGVCLETNGIMAPERLGALAPLVELFLIDFKHADTEAHRRYTGLGNEVVYRSLDLLEELGAKFILRSPIIPGVNDTAAHFEELKRLRGRYAGMVGFELMPYHSFGLSKWYELGLSPPLPSVEAPSESAVASWREATAMEPAGFRGA